MVDIFRNYIKIGNASFPRENIRGIKISVQKNGTYLTVENKTELLDCSRCDLSTNIAEIPEKQEEPLPEYESCTIQIPDCAALEHSLNENRYEFLLCSQ